MGLWSRNTALAALTGLIFSAGCAAGSEEDPVLNSSRQSIVDSINGLRTINGLTTINGLRTINGLTTINGLKTINGLTTINGLRTINGLKTINGLSVDCTGLTAGVDCTGEPDGLMSASTGLMSTDDGIITAKYLVRCALPNTASLRIKDYTGGLVSLAGEAGLAPEWADGQCSTACEEKVSACLMALTNGHVDHVAVELSAPFTLGSGHSSAYKYQEAVFYGNVFSSPPKGNFSVGSDYAGLNLLGLSIGVVDDRLCSSWDQQTNQCPYSHVGDANFQLLDPLGLTSNKCTMSGGSATKCRDKSGTTWNYPITTYRLDKGAT